MLLDCLLVGIGGFAGSVCRYLFSFIPFFQSALFPFSTLTINFIGSFLISFITGLSAGTGVPGPRAMLLLRVGVCGGFTTFSAFSMETMALFEDMRILAGVSYALISVVLCLIGIVLGRLAVRILPM